MKGFLRCNLIQVPFLRQTNYAIFRNCSTTTNRDGAAMAESRFAKVFTFKSLTPVPLGQPKVQFISRVLDTDRTVKVTAKGKEQSMRALVVTGNGSGSAGFALGKGKTVDEALQDARRLSMDTTKWVSIPIQPDGRLYVDSRGSFKGTQVLLRRVKESKKGLTCGRLIHGICEAFGIKHITAKRITRKRSPYNFCNAVFIALVNQKNPDDAAKIRGGKVDRSTVNFNYNKLE